MFQPVRNKRLHQQIFEQIQALILNGELKPGDKLPSERVLVEMLKASRNSIREALRSLEILGIIECRHGGGNFIRCDMRSGLIEPLSIMFQLHGGNFTDILEVRRSLEAEAIALAAVRITPEQSECLRNIIEKIRVEKDEDESIRLDKEFHLKIAEFSGNMLLLAFLTAISSILEKSIKDGRRVIMRSFRNHKELFKAHEKIYASIAAHDKDAAVKEIGRHFKMIIDNIHKS